MGRTKKVEEELKRLPSSSSWNDLEGNKVERQEDGIVKSPLLEKLNNAPNSFKLGRVLEVQRSRIEKEFLDRNNAVLTVGGDGKKVSPITLSRLNVALGQVLYNTSYVNRNTKANTGLAVNGVLSDGGSLPPLKTANNIYHYAEIQVKLNELASIAFGVDDPTNAQKKEIMEALAALQNDGVNIKYPDGDELMRSLVWIKGHNIINKAKTLDIVLNPIYALEVVKNFAEHPQDIIRRLNATGQVTDAKMKLLSLLGIQDKRKPFYIYLKDLLERLGMIEEYKKKKTRTLEKLESLFSSMVDVGIIIAKPTQKQKKRSGEEETEFIFSLNPNYCK